MGGGAQGYDGSSPVLPMRLRCEHLVDPLGIDVVRPRLTWVLEAPVALRCVRQVAYQVLVASSASALARDGGDLWDSGRVESDQTALVPYDGVALLSRQRCFWKARVWTSAAGKSSLSQSSWSESAIWEMGLLDPGEWMAEWVTLARPAEGEELHTAAAYFRVPFVLPSRGSIERARVYVTALGVYELWCNGVRVSEDRLRPGWTDYDKRLAYQVYELDDCVQPGANLLAAVVGDGWYAGNLGMGKRQVWGAWPELLAQVEVDVGGAIEVVGATNASTTRASFGPIVANDLQMGETYDARRELSGWTSTGFDDAGWTGPFVPYPGGGPVGRLTANCAPPVRPLEERAPIGMTSPAPGVWIFDLGQNIVGWCRLRVNGESGCRAGDVVMLRHGEMLEPDGSLYTENLRAAANTDRYIASGDGGDVVWEPSFTFHGFRYVEVTGYPADPPPSAITGIVAGSALSETGSFECSSRLVNQLWSNIRWGQRGNFLEVPTDCPQRDERLGWMGDAQIFAGTAAYNMDVAAFFTKWLADVRDAQLDIGAYPDVCPRFGRANPTAAPGWGDAGVIVPWVLYQRYGDVGLARSHYESARRWIEYLWARNPDLRWTSARGCDWGDHVAIDDDNPHDVLATAWWAYSAGLLSSLASVVGEDQDARRYASLAAGIRRAFAAAHIGDDGFIEGDTQTVYALALQFGLAADDPSVRAAVAARLVGDIESRGWHLSTGFMGIAHLLPALTASGHLDVAYRLLLNETFPSWGYSIVHGATTIWERWDGWTEHGGFQNPGMNSFNHYAFGAVGEWLYTTIGGVSVDHWAAEPGHDGDSGDGSAEVITIRPRPGGGLTSASCSYDSIYGVLRCAWSLLGDEEEAENGAAFELSATVPAGRSAAVWVPCGGDDVVFEGGAPAASAEGVAVLGRADGCAVYRVGSGSYRFAVRRAMRTPMPSSNGR